MHPFPLSPSHPLIRFGHSCMTTSPRGPVLRTVDNPWSGARALRRDDFEHVHPRPGGFGPHRCHHPDHHDKTWDLWLLIQALAASPGCNSVQTVRSQFPNGPLGNWIGCVRESWDGSHGPQVRRAPQRT